MTQKLHSLALAVTLSITAALSIQAQPGTLDTTFGTGGITIFESENIYAYSTAAAVAIQTDGKIVVAGNYYAYNNNNNSGCILTRYNTDGSLDATFGTNGVAKKTLTNTIITCMVLQADGKIVLAGTITTNSESQSKALNVLRFNTDGTPDPTFASEGISLYPGNWNNMTLAPDGKILIGGDNNGPNPAMQVGRLNADGSADWDFYTPNMGYVAFSIGPMMGANYSKSYCTKVLSQSDGKIILAGYYTYAPTGNNKRMAIIRINSDATFDYTFAESGLIYAHPDMGYITGYHDHIQTAALQNDGKILLAGNTQQTDGGNSAFLLMRMNADGTADGSFGPFGTVTYSTGLSMVTAKCIAVQPDGKIILAGSVIGNEQDLALIRFLSNGDVDTEFGTNGVVSTHLSGQDQVKSIVLQANGKIVVAATVGDYTTDAELAVARYNGGGSTAGIEDITVNTIMAYPNPVQGILTLKNLPEATNEAYTIINSMGQKVSEGILTEEITSINMSGMASGIYLLQVQDKPSIRIIKN